MKSVACAVTLLFIFIRVYPQDQAPDHGVKYFFNFSNGSLIGPSATAVSYTACTVHGVAYKKLRLGGGVGFDSYSEWQALPLFGQFSYDLLGSRNVLFIQCSYGWSHAWMQKPEHANVSSQEGGRMFNTMLGYRIASGNLNATIGVGYKFQRVRSTTNYFYYDYFPSQGWSTETELGLERFVITLGIGWR